MIRSLYKDQSLVVSTFQQNGAAVHGILLCLASRRRSLMSLILMRFRRGLIMLRRVVYGSDFNRFSGKVGQSLVLRAVHERVPLFPLGGNVALGRFAVSFHPILPIVFLRFSLHGSHLQIISRFFRSETDLEDFQGSLLGIFLTFNALENFLKIFWKTYGGVFSYVSSLIANLVVLVNGELLLMCRFSGAPGDLINSSCAA
ncbi:hypothetical protein DY000_02046733 [Brassica cretica]|uniref:Protein RFT1 homolog n=1 Tax=Brassica cretica TaxID=69181 RepID=A0ABQ7EZ10_BRACR|nr:hypothetical protein DY000_02046733 [Brassica cretica]